MDEAVTCSNNHPPRNLWMCSTHNVRDMRSRLADQLHVANRGVVVQRTGDETCLVESVGLRDDLLSANDHVVHVKPPCPLHCLRHARLPVQ